MTAALLLGLLIGMRHALEADHVAAVAALVLRAKSSRSSIRHGIVWGLGHTITLFVVGTFVILTNVAVPPDMAAVLEGCVGLMLILLGLDVARKIVRDRVHFHVHEHGNDVRHVHAHSHRDEPKEAHDPAAHRHPHLADFSARALYVGLMHGLAGSAALIVLTLDRTYTVFQGLAYMGLFGLGSIIGMAILSAAIAIPMQRAGTRLTWFHRGMEGFVSTANIALGSILVVTALGTPA